MTPSIHLRMTLAASFVLAAFLGLSAYALDKAFRDSVEEGFKNRLQGHIYALLGAAETDASGGMRFPEDLPDPRFSNPDSGLYAGILGSDGRYQWHSPSLLGREISYSQTLAPGAKRFQRNDGLYLLGFGLGWVDNAGHEQSYTVVVAETTAGMEAEIGGFRLTLFLWLGGAALLLLLVQGVTLRWGLSPLRRAARDLKRIQAGKAEFLGGSYPSELRGLTNNVNALISHGRANQIRYRNRLGDLAHSLKTPLAVLQGAADGNDADDLLRAVREQVPRMNEIVQYQLQRAAVAGKTDVARAIAVGPAVQKLIAALEKVYRDKGVTFSAELPAGARFFGDEGDLLEVLGNLLENACKYCRSRIRITASDLTGDDRPRLTIVIEDDGNGIPETEREQVLRRGERRDQQLPGQGIGLSVVDEIVRLYQGTLAIDASDLGGARITVRW
jgi:two-component system sensor histidine kinase PhoQ